MGFVLYQIIKAAIDDSEMAKNIRAIRIALEKNPESLPSSVEDLEPEDNF